MLHLRNSILICMCSFWIATQSKAIEPANELNEVQIKALIKTLGSESFVSREQAGEMLLRQGNKSIPALKDATQSNDLEVARRARILLNEIQTTEKSTLLKVFVEAGEKNGTLPGWDRFQKLVGNDKKAREFYAGIFRKDGALIEDSETDAKVGLEILSSKALGLHNTLYNGVSEKSAPIDIIEISTVLFLAANPAIKLPQEITYNITNLLYQQPSRTILGETNPHPYRKLIISWMLNQSDPNIVSQHLYLSLNLNLKEGMLLARRCIENKEMPVYTKAVAMTLVGKLGGPDDSRLLDPYLEDTSLVGNFQLADQQKGSTQIRDVALAMLIQMEKKSHKDYGFSFARANLTMHFNPYTMGFTSNEARTNAFMKWQSSKNQTSQK